MRSPKKKPVSYLSRRWFIAYHTDPSNVHCWALSKRGSVVDGSFCQLTATQTPAHGLGRITPQPVIEFIYLETSSVSRTYPHGSLSPEVGYLNTDTVTQPHAVHTAWRGANQ